MSQEHLNIIKEVAVKAGELALKHQQDLSKLHITKKNIGDFVSKADLECEELIKKELNSNFEGFSFLCEESGEEIKDSNYLWIIDPIDGTTNYLKGMKSYSCCICLQEKGKTIVSVVYFPALDELYYASRDKDGSFLEFPKSPNIKTIQLQHLSRISLEDSLISYGVERTHFSKTYSFMNRLYNKCAGTRYLGAVSLDIVKVARGEFGAFIKAHTKDWDLYPAAYIAQKVGATICDLNGNKISSLTNYDTRRDGCLVSNPYILSEIKELTKPTLEIAGELAREVYEEKICPLANKAVETSTPYVKEACKKSKPYMKQAWKFTKVCYAKTKPLAIKLWEIIKIAYSKAKPHVIAGLIWIKDRIIDLFNLINNKIKK